jgi:hypothetical protein
MQLFLAQLLAMVSLTLPLVTYGYMTELFGRTWVKLQDHREQLELTDLLVPQVKLDLLDWKVQQAHKAHVAHKDLLDLQG